MRNLIDKAAKTHNLDYEELISLIKDDSDNDYLFKKADEVRKKYVGDDVHLRGLIEFSNICGRTCRYCGLNRENKKIERYGMKPEEIYQTAKKAVQLGYKTVVLQSGDSEVYSTEQICSIIRKIKMNAAKIEQYKLPPFSEYAKKYIEPRVNQWQTKSYNEGRFTGSSKKCKYFFERC